MQQIINSLAWVMVHSLWQGLLAALLAAIIISCTRKSVARLRYNLLGMVMILFLITAFITFFVQLDKQEKIAGSLYHMPKAVNNIPEITTAVSPTGINTDLTSWVNDNTGLLLTTWALFFLLNCMKLTTGLMAVRRLRHYKTFSITDEWKIRLEQLRDSLGIRQSITLLQSELVKVPVTLGFLRPVILLPVGLIANIPAEQVEAVLLHELGHIKRKDFFVNFLQHFAEAIFFFNPSLLWISSLLRQEREACCDDIVVNKIGQKRHYLNALVSFEEYSLHHMPYAMAISSKKQYLLHRVKRIVTNENKKLNPFEKLALLSGLLLFSAFTYVTREKMEMPAATCFEQGTIRQQPFFQLKETDLVKPAVQPAKKEKKKSLYIQTTIADTIPAKKEKTDASIITGKITETPPVMKTPEIKITDADRALQEIIKIKEQIGEKKESIGKSKAELAIHQGKNNSEEAALKAKIEKERKEVEVKRDELNRKRAEYESLKIQEIKNKQREINQAKKKEVQPI